MWAIIDVLDVKCRNLEVCLLQAVSYEPPRAECTGYNGWGTLSSDRRSNPDTSLADFAKLKRLESLTVHLRDLSDSSVVILSPKLKGEICAFSAMLTHPWNKLREFPKWFRAESSLCDGWNICCQDMRWVKYMLVKSTLPVFYILSKASESSEWSYEMWWIPHIATKSCTPQNCLSGVGKPILGLSRSFEMSR